MALKKLADRLWIGEQNLGFMGLEIGARMSIVDLDGKGTLFVHSPIRPTADLIEAIRTIGNVTYVVAPNKWHHLYIGDFKKAFPSARFFGAPGLDEKRSDFQFESIITSEQTLPWNPQLEHTLVEGAPFFGEVVFFHPQSRTLLLTDVALHICENAPFKTRLIFKLMGAYKKFGLSFIEKVIFIKDRAAFRATLQKISNWDFDRIIIAHGKIIDTDGKNRFENGLLNSI